MTFTLDTDQQSMRLAVQTLLQKHSKPEDVRSAALQPGGFDHDLWKMLAFDMGLAALLVPAEHDGLGLGNREVGVVLREMGSALACAPFFSSSVLATQLILAAGDAGTHQEILPGLASGQTIATLALCDEGRADYSLDRVTMVADEGPQTTLLSGTKNFVLDGTSADMILVVARHDRGLGLYRVSSEAAGLNREPMEVMDATRPLARVQFDRVEAERMHGGDASDALTRGLALSSVGLAAEQVGAARECVRMSVEYAKIRVQFGKPIGGFQAIKHMLADDLSAVEAADAATSYAAHIADSRADDVELAAAIAQAASSDAYLRAAANCVHVHGAMGFTEECDAQLFFKRSKSSAQLLGSADLHRAAAARLLGL